MGRRLYVGNLPYTVGEAELQDLFAQAGGVERAQVIRDTAAGRSRGFGFVEMATDEDAQRAIDQFHGYLMAGRALVVNEARPRPENFGGGRPRGRSTGGRGRGRREPRW
jgi:cold-inducible RNA-binding protein